MTYLSQRNTAWAMEKIGYSPLLVGRYGCTLTCLSMLSDYFRCFRDPVQIAHNAAWFTKDGLVVWSALKFDNFKFVRRAYDLDDRMIREHMADPDLAVILQVDGFHWVVGIKPSVFGQYVIVDPWDGKKKTLRSAYKAVTGAAYFARK